MTHVLPSQSKLVRRFTAGTNSILATWSVALIRCGERPKRRRERTKTHFTSPTARRNTKALIKMTRLGKELKTFCSTLPAITADDPIYRGHIEGSRRFWLDHGSMAVIGPCYAVADLRDLHLTGLVGWVVRVGACAGPPARSGTGQRAAQRTNNIS